MSAIAPFTAPVRVAAPRAARLSVRASAVPESRRAVLGAIFAGAHTNVLSLHNATPAFAGGVAPPVLSPGGTEESLHRSLPLCTRPPTPSPGRCCWLLARPGWRCLW